MTAEQPFAHLSKVLTDPAYRIREMAKAIVEGRGK